MYNQYMEEKIQFVDKNDQPIGAGTREEAWAKGIYQRLSIILLTDGEGNVLLQKRSELKKIYPGAWTASASGHVDEGETYEMAARRELKEEIGVDTELQYVGKFLTEEIIDEKDARMFNSVFTGMLSRNTKLNLDEKEVSDTDWFKISELVNNFSSNPTLYTPSLKQSIHQFFI